MIYFSAFFSFRQRTVTRGVNKVVKEDFKLTMVKQMGRSDEPVEKLIRTFLTNERISILKALAWETLFLFCLWLNKKYKAVKSMFVWGTWSRFWSVFLKKFYCLQYFSNAFLMINFNLSVSSRVMSKIQSWQFFVM